MNAIVGLCHFCEAHGPRPLFCTFTTNDEKYTTESSQSGVQCSGCTSVGPETVYRSKDSDGTMYCSRESVPNTNVTTFLRQAAIRSITCEVNWNKEGGIVYFNDSLGHVLSITFQVKDTLARGLKRWFSIVVLMKDRMLLLSITSLLSEYMQRISKDLQVMADMVYDAEQKICSQRALRLKTGRNDFGQSRSLKDLTGNEDVFKALHSHFTWMLKAGAKTYSEKLYTSCDLLKKLQPQSLKHSIFDPSVCFTSNEEYISLRSMDQLLSRAFFRVVMYCTLIGVQVVIKSTNTQPDMIVKGLTRLLPVNKPMYTRIQQYNGQENISNTTCVVEEIENNSFKCHWGGTIPGKCPTLMSRIENAMSNDKFNNNVLNQQIKSLQLEWLGIAKTVKAAIQSAGPRSDAVVKLKQVLGVAQHDECLLNHWINEFCD